MLLLIIATALGIVGLALMFAGVLENPALAKFVAGAFLVDLATAIAAAWASTKGPGR